MKFFFVVFVIFVFDKTGVILATEDFDQSAVKVLQDIYYGCVRDFSISCAKPKALQWISDVSNNERIKITEDLAIVKKDNPGDIEVIFLKIMYNSVSFITRTHFLLFILIIFSIFTQGKCSIINIYHLLC